MKQEYNCMNQSKVKAKVLVNEVSQAEGVFRQSKLCECDRCDATGYLPEYKHFLRGVCFKCKGSGVYLYSSYSPNTYKHKIKLPKPIKPLNKVIVSPSPVESLDSYKLKILESINNKTLSFDQKLAVWNNRNRYKFTANELNKLELYKAEVKPLYKVYPCPQCGMVGDNCTCDRSWY